MTRLQGNSSNRTFLVLGTLVALLLIAATVWAVQRGQSSGAAAGTQTFDLANQPFLGKEDAPVTLVAFEDFKCPVCKNFEENVLPSLQQKYIDTGKAKFYLLSFPFIAQMNKLDPDDSQLAAEGARCVYDQQSNKGFFDMAALLFRAQGPENQVWASQDKIVELAGSVDGVDPAKLRQCLTDGTSTAKVNAEEQQGTKAGVNSTPSIFVNGKLVNGFSADAVGQAIDAASTPQ